MSQTQVSFAAHAQRVGANKCPRCGELVSFDGNNDPYCPYADCHWNNEENDCPPPPASANGSVRSLAAPAEPGVGVDTLLRFDGVLSPGTRPRAADIAGDWRGAWFLDWQVGGALDAPDETPRGGHYSLEVGDHVCAVGFRYEHYLTGRM